MSTVVPLSDGGGLLTLVADLEREGDESIGASLNLLWCELKFVASARGLYSGMGAVGSGGGAGVLKSLLRPFRVEEPGRGGGRNARLEDAVASLGEIGYRCLDAGDGEGGWFPSNSPSELLSGPKESMLVAMLCTSSRGVGDLVLWCIRSVVGRLQPVETRRSGASLRRRAEVRQSKNRSNCDGRSMQEEARRCM